MRLYRFVAIFSIISMLMMTFTGCAIPEEVKDEADERLNTHKQYFIDKVAEHYGDDGKLKNIECPIVVTGSSPVPSIRYSVSNYLTGTLIVNKMRYDAFYDIEKDCMFDSVHTNKIMNTIVSSLPLEYEPIQTKISNQYHQYPMFQPDVTNFEEALLAKTMNGYIHISVFTSEELKEYKDFDFMSIETLNKMADSELHCEIRIISIADKEKLSTLVGKVHELHFSYQNYHPKVYYGGGYRDAFDLYHIKEVLNLSYKKDKNGNTYIECVYNN